eukprot:scaffold236412_cov32-Tisochrysis_lutea.AAC.1
MPSRVASKSSSLESRRCFRAGRCGGRSVREREGRPGMMRWAVGGGARRGLGGGRHGADRAGRGSVEMMRFAREHGCWWDPFVPPPVRHLNGAKHQTLKKGLRKNQ